MESVQPSLNTWTIIFLVVAGFGFFLTLIILNTKTKKKICRNSLAGITLAFSILMVLYVGYWTNYINYVPKIFNYWVVCVFAIAPLFYFYVYYAQRNISFKKSHLLYFIPTFIVLFVYLVQSLTGWIDMRYNLTLSKSHLLYYPLRYMMYLSVPVSMITHLLVFLVMSIRDVYKNQFRITHQPKNSLPWLRLLLILYAGYVFSLTLYYILIRIPEFKIEWDYMVSFAMATFVYTIGFIGYTRPEILNGKIFEFQPFILKYKTSTLTETAARILAVKMDQKMIEQELYLNSDLKIKSLADELDCTIHQLSQVINERKGLHFNDYINKFRIQRSIEMMHDERFTDEPLKTIAYSVGFNNPTSFYKAFKKVQGMSPSDYRNQSRNRHESSETA